MAEITVQDESESTDIENKTIPKRGRPSKGLASLVRPKISERQNLSSDEITKWRSAIAKGDGSWDSLLNSLEDARLAGDQAVLVQGGTGEDPETKEVSAVMQEVQAIIDGLPLDIKDRLLKTMGAGLAESLVQRYGTAAPSVLRKNCIEREPRDPVIMVEIKSGKIVFDHLDEFRENPWGVTHPRAGSLMAGMNGTKGYKIPEPVQVGNQERVLIPSP